MSKAMTTDKAQRTVGKTNGVQADADARRKVQRVALRIGATDIRLGEAEGGGVRLAFAVNGYQVMRVQGRLPTLAENYAAIVLWFETRVRWVERGVDSLDEAFADSVIGRPEHPTAKPQQAGYAKGKAPTATVAVNTIITLFRATIERLGVPERNAKVTWDTEAMWAKMRLRLPSGRVLEKTVHAPVTKGGTIVPLHLLALWFKDRVGGRDAGWECEDIDQLFAEHLLPVGAA